MTYAVGDYLHADMLRSFSCAPHCKINFVLSRFAANEEQRDRDLFAYFFLERNRQKKTFRNQTHMKNCNAQAGISTVWMDILGAVEIEHTEYQPTHSAGDFGTTHAKGNTKDFLARA